MEAATGSITIDQVAQQKPPLPVFMIVVVITGNPADNLSPCLQVQYTIEIIQKIGPFTCRTAFSFLPADFHLPYSVFYVIVVHARKPGNEAVSRSDVNQLPIPYVKEIGPCTY